eukprot:15101937-Ditylum_brightwellii.AAC.1
MKLGYVPERVYDELNFPLDMAGNKVFFRPHSIEAEWMQRSKQLTSYFQILARRDRLKKLDSLHSKKLEKERSKVVVIINQNREAES